jgi:hypothetical protein
MHKESFKKLLNNLIIIRAYLIGRVMIIGTVVHEFWHYIIACLFQAKVAKFRPFIFQKGKLLDVKNFNSVKGEVLYENDSNLRMSSLAAFCTSISPILSIVVIVYIYNCNILFIEKYIKYLMLVAAPILINSFPSIGDFQFYNFHLRKNNTTGLLAKISWLVFYICVLCGRKISIVAQETLVILSLLLIVTMLTTIKVDTLSVTVTLTVYIFIGWCFRFLLKKFQITSDFVQTPVKEYYLETFPNCNLLFLLRGVFISFIRVEDIVPKALGLDIKINNDTLESFLLKFPLAKESPSHLELCRVFDVDLTLDSLPSQSGRFIFRKDNGNLEQFYIYFNNCDSKNTLNTIWKRCLDMEKFRFLSIIKLMFPHKIDSYQEVPCLRLPFAGNYLEIATQNNQELVLCYSTFWSFRVLPLIVSPSG